MVNRRIAVTCKALQRAQATFLLTIDNHLTNLRLLSTV